MHWMTGTGHGPVYILWESWESLLKRDKGEKKKKLTLDLRNMANFFSMGPDLIFWFFVTP